MISSRRYYCRLLIAIWVVCVLLVTGTHIANAYSLRLQIITEICSKTIMGLLCVLFGWFITTITINRGLNAWIRNTTIRRSIENNLISIGAYQEKEDKVFVVVPSIKVKDGIITIKLRDIKIRKTIEQYLNSFSTALPKRFIVEDFYFSRDGDSLIIAYEDLKTYNPEKYSLTEYLKIIKKTSMLELYLDQKHTIDLKLYPHLLISGSSGSGKSYLVYQLVLQAITKGYDIVICDIKRTYGAFRNNVTYLYDGVTILEKLRSIENEMYMRMEALEKEIDTHPTATAVDIGYNPMMIIIEEYISLISSFDKKGKEELERIIKNISVLARQSDIHLLMVMQSAGTENISATTRSNMTKVLLGNAQSNILTATFGTGVDIPHSGVKLTRGEGLIQLDRITLLRVPYIDNIDTISDVMGAIRKD